MNRCIYGVDINPRAVKLGKLSLWLESANPGTKLEKLDTQLKTADTLGDDFKWKKEFDNVFKMGGFDAVIGNPPYRRELDYKELFNAISKTKLGKEFSMPRMDLWYYFVHRGLELVKENGALSYITNAYWTSGTSAKKMIEAIKEDCFVEEIFYLSGLKVFKDVSGQHTIFKILKDSIDAKTLIKVPPENYSEKTAESLVKGEIDAVEYFKTKKYLFNTGKVDIEEGNEELLEHLSTFTHLSELGLIRQGIAENPSSIGKKVNEKNNDKWTIGEGVFCLTDDEVKNLKLSSYESKLLRPYHDLCDIRRYFTSSKTSKQLIYSTKESCPDINKYPILKAHLSRFKTLMSLRRETVKGSNKWWHLHWPRDKNIWKSEFKIFSIQMSERPTFSSMVGESYAPFSVNVFVPNSDSKDDLLYYEAVLNSALIWKWYQHNAKKRGVGLEINGNVLERTPIKVIDKLNSSEVNIYNKIITEIKKLKKLVKSKNTSALKIEEIEFSIDNLIYDLYQIDSDVSIEINRSLGLYEVNNKENVTRKAA